MQLLSSMNFFKLSMIRHYFRYFECKTNIVFPSYRVCYRFPPFFKSYRPFLPNFYDMISVTEKSWKASVLKLICDVNLTCNFDFRLLMFYKPSSFNLILIFDKFYECIDLMENLISIM